MSDQKKSITLSPKLAALREKIAEKRKEAEKAASTAVRNDLLKKIVQVHETGEDIVITADGKALAVLTVNRPLGTKPMLIKTTDAAQGWSDLLNLVSVSNARFYFSLKPKSPGSDSRFVYLVRGKYRNRFLERWQEHRENFAQQVEAPKAPQNELDSLEKADQIFEKIEAIESALGGLTRQVATAFAYQNREGDLLKTPETGVVPYRTADDFINPHCGD